MGNTGTGGEWSFGAGTSFILKQGAVGSASSDQDQAVRDHRYRQRHPGGQSGDRRHRLRRRL
ncbi:MAG: hypothetical protein R3D85_15055 [Paracoccaceae bacterium]